MLNSSKLHTTQLANIASIRMGDTCRSKRRSAPDGDTLLVQPNNISPDGHLQTSQLARVRIALLAAEHLLCPGDLIFRSWGDNNTTALVGTMAERAVCVAPLIVLRILPNAAVLPGYLHWFMNLSLTRSHINNYPRDRASRVIAPALLSGLKAVVPAINRQEKILQIAQLDLQARAMEDRIVEIRRLETETSLFQYAQGIARKAVAPGDGIL
jgi:hypothetical protein